MIVSSAALSLFAAAALTYAVAPIAIRIANATAFYDRPAGYKAHADPTPYLGGVAVMGGFVIVALVVLSIEGSASGAGVLGGMAVLWALGTLDDRHPVAPTLRLGIEVLLGAGLWALDLGWQLGLGGGADLLVTVAWIVGVVNAFNLFDNMDGAAASIGFVVALGASALGLIAGDDLLALTAAALAGACAGFLPYNLSSPARIFLGDGGSLPLGYGVATLVMLGSTQSLHRHHFSALIIAVLVVGLPTLDTTLVIISRRRRGVSIFTPGRDHLTHRLLRWLPTPRAVAVALGCTQAILIGLALLGTQGGTMIVAPALALYMVAGAAAIVWLETRTPRPVHERRAADGLVAERAHQLAARNGSDPPLVTNSLSGVRD